MKPRVSPTWTSPGAKAPPPSSHQFWRRAWSSAAGGDQGHRSDESSEKIQIRGRGAMCTCDVVDSILAPFEQEVPHVSAFAVHGFPLHEHAVIRAAPLAGSPPPDEDVPQLFPADTWAWRAVSLWTGFHDQMADRLAIDADVTPRHIEAAHFEGKDGIGR
jgi:hypothetical protein